MIKSAIEILILAYTIVGISALFGFSESAGLFGAIVGIGAHLNLKQSNKQKEKE